jgi:hypothetical protein
MILSEMVRKIDLLGDNLAVCVRRPWEAAAETRVVELDSSLRVPQTILDEGFEYFLEVHVIKEVLQVLRGRNVSVEDKTALLIHYAQNDAYPSWVYEI